MKYYAIQQMEREATIAIYGDLVPYQWDESDVTAYNLQKEIKDLDVDVINVRINSCGGSVSEGWAIYNALKAHPAKVRTYGDGFVASAALYPFLAGDERIANSVSGYYLHQVLTSAYGNADDLRKTADEIETLNQIGLKAFADVGVDADKVLELMKEEVWLTPDQALEMGIATEIRKNAVPENSAVQHILQVLTEPRQQQGQNSVEINKINENELNLQKEEPEEEDGQITLKEFLTTLKGD